MIGRSGKRGSEISVLAARHDDDDEVFFAILPGGEIEPGASWWFYSKAYSDQHFIHCTMFPAGLNKGFS